MVLTLIQQGLYDLARSEPCVGRCEYRSAAKPETSGTYAEAVAMSPDKGSSVSPRHLFGVDVHPKVHIPSKQIQSH